MNKLAYLSCIHCLKEFQHQEIFVAFVDESDKVVIASHDDCGPASDKPEREGTGWAVLERDYDHYIMHDIDKIFNELS